MGIFLDKEQDKTAEEKLIHQIKNSNTLALNGLKRHVVNTIRFIFSSPNPQQIVDSFGNSASNLVIGLEKINELITLLDSSWTPPELPVNIRINKDGTVTLIPK